MSCGIQWIFSGEGGAHLTPVRSISLWRIKASQGTKRLFCLSFLPTLVGSCHFDGYWHWTYKIQLPLVKLHTFKLPQKGEFMYDKIFVDFDDTLCLHSHKIDSKRFITTSSEYISDEAYKDSILNNSLYEWLLEKQNDPKSQAQVYILTAASSFMLEAKKTWIKMHCPKLDILDFIGVSIDVTKADIVEAYSKVYKERPLTAETNIFFIDDNPADRHSVKEACDRVIVMSPQYIAELV